MSPESILSALFRVGLSDNITALSASAFYLALRKCERISPKAACSYYRYLIEERRRAGTRLWLHPLNTAAFSVRGKYGATLEDRLSLWRSGIVDIAGATMFQKA